MVKEGRKGKEEKSGRGVDKEICMDGLETGAGCSGSAIPWDDEAVRAGYVWGSGLLAKQAALPLFFDLCVVVFASSLLCCA